MTDTSEQTFKGLVYVKIGRIGSRSEGPDYYLQTARGEFPLRYQQRNLWQPDYHLEFFNRRKVAVTGTLNDKIITVKTIEEIWAPLMPRDQAQQVKLAVGASAKVGDVTVGFGKITQDSRCPTGAVCVWEGQAIASLWASPAARNFAEQFELTLRAGHPDLATKAILGHRFTLLQVEPHPAIGTHIDPEQYVITVEVEDL